MQVQESTRSDEFRSLRLKGVRIVLGGFPKMAKMVRVTLSMSPELLAQFDRTQAGLCSPNRSESVRRLMQSQVSCEVWNEEKREVVATLTLIYECRCSDLARRLTALQHEGLDLIVATNRVHLDTELCMEVLIMKGRADRLSDLATRIGGTRGVVHGGLVVAMTDGVSKALILGQEPWK
jgi:CopG family nickel-responsive transcriptional regulator